MITVESTGPGPIPAWARLQRQAIAAMNEAAPAFVRRYTNADGTLVWRDEWPGMDGSDDGYESFASFPLFYALGGSPEVHELSRKEWNAITRQFTGYGQIWREFDAYYDWMHHGEGNLCHYYFGLADPKVAIDRERALRFAAMYMGEDPEADNWDAERRMIRSPITGSRGPRFRMTAEDWVTHRPILADYLSPYEDVPGTGADRNPMALANWNDDVIFTAVLERMNERMARGDVPLNLTATSLITHAFLHTGEEEYRAWVLDYLGAWRERTEANGGITPDNIGPSGRIGECMNGKWWGGYYGWRWPHGAFSILEPLLIAGSNALLLTGDRSHLDLARSQYERLLALGKVENGVYVVPTRHGDAGWFDYRRPDPRYLIHLHFLTGADRDRERLLGMAGRESWSSEFAFGKGGQVVPRPWSIFAECGDPGYPEAAMRQTLREIDRRLEVMRTDDGDPAEWDVHHWQDISPVVCEPLLQLTTGTPGIVYHGGLCHARIRHFDPVNRRPGLPDSVAALVSRIQPGGIDLELVNTHTTGTREVIVQAGAFGEHLFTGIATTGTPDPARFEIPEGCPSFRAVLRPLTVLRLELAMHLFARSPSYALPWDAQRGRQL